jgi:hypothetical protein
LKAVLSKLLKAWPRKPRGAGERASKLGILKLNPGLSISKEGNGMGPTPPFDQTLNDGEPVGRLGVQYEGRRSRSPINT